MLQARTIAVGLDPIVPMVLGPIQPTVETDGGVERVSPERVAAEHVHLEVVGKGEGLVQGQRQMRTVLPNKMEDLGVVDLEEGDLVLERQTEVVVLAEVDLEVGEVVLEEEGDQVMIAVPQGRFAEEEMEKKRLR